MKIIFFREVDKVFSKKKKFFIMFGMIALLAVTSALNLFLSKSGTELETTSIQSANFLTSYRASKSETRQTILEYYESIIESSTSADQITETNALISDLAGRMEQETVLEGLITASGYEDCVVTNADGSYTVMVKSAGLTSDDVAKILGILVKETGVQATNVKITSV